MLNYYHANYNADFKELAKSTDKSVELKLGIVSNDAKSGSSTEEIKILGGPNKILTYNSLLIPYIKKETLT